MSFKITGHEKSEFQDFTADSKMPCLDAENALKEADLPNRDPI